MNFPLFWGVTQNFDTSKIEDPGNVCRKRLEEFCANGPDLHNRTIAVGVGSRGIADLPAIVKAVIDFLKSKKARPFIVPAMGSHGGATSEGQTAMLDSLGISEASMGVEIHAGMSVKKLGELPNGLVINFSEEALKANYILPIVRVKQHTMLSGDVQSGLSKMLVIGLGKHAGATEFHKFGIEEVIVPSTEFLLQQINLLCGVAVVENSYDQICALEVVSPKDCIDADRRLLRLARQKLPKVPFDTLDGLVIDKIGKEISGSGADVNVIGKWRRDGGPRDPNYKLIAVLGITEISHGNATGIGNADLIPARFLDDLDYNAMRINVLTSGTIRAAKLPLHVDDDRKILEIMLNSVPHPEKIRLARISDTLHLRRFYITEALLEEAGKIRDLKIDDKPQEAVFDDSGVWLPFK